MAQQRRAPALSTAVCQHQSLDQTVGKVHVVIALVMAQQYVNLDPFIKW